MIIEKTPFLPRLVSNKNGVPRKSSLNERGLIIINNKNYILKKHICQDFSHESDEKIFTLDGKQFLTDNETGELLQVLDDVSSTGKKRNWALHKRENRSLEGYYREIAKIYELTNHYDDAKKWINLADRLQNCASFLKFNVYPDAEFLSGERKKIVAMNSCYIRLCPMCSWRRSNKIFSQCRKIISAMETEQAYDYLLLTLTVPNVTADKLINKINEMMSAWNRFIGYKRFKNAVLGWYRTLEITHNVNPYSKSFDTFHPHFHCILAVPKDWYFDTNYDFYINQSEWLSMWQKAMNDYSITQVDVRKIRSRQDKDIIGAICEVAKYSVKTGDYIIPSDWVLTINTILTLTEVLAYRRLVAFGGVMKEWHKKLNLDDPIDGDLMSDGEDVNGELLRTECYIWNTGYQQYIRKS